ncbi:MAG: amino acid ABC transporter permease [Lactococcus sp.]|jgi:polar amino acid transport system permease protein|uniref:Putative glutamine transport system permease protein 2 GlnP2 n=1 Tax=Pseudolactococcus piscium MKFS47 TaxID=297352 RepID=A0A0D6DUU5_9LACT|nr:MULTISPECIES: amino acid ABC transporter permease [Lactococcus]MBR6895626.1 amino acid ABC transporter permease [Lactococcus sp.]MCJ1971898.1 amino acid ABC transporter permease [Lactococcus carnosus]MDN5403849.1 amino acid ABC transporter permease [Lactococcus sp.]MDN5410290.1 amino acid ABC transporter permease [Lactococcus sp.]MDN5412530.1 amino acid ABC transporter permease [Lactococcus sp.]
MSFNFIDKFLPYFNDGLIVTLMISAFVVIFGTILGTLIALGKLSKVRPIRWLSNIYIEVFRGTPMLVQIMIGFQVLGKMPLPEFQLGILTEDLSRLVPGIIVLSMNSGAYVAEIVRSGINAVPKGQTEAAYSLGIRPRQTMIKVILPQAIRNILPALGNEFVTIIKDSSLLATIGVMELYNGAQTTSSTTYQSLSPWLLVAVYYFVVTFITSRLINLLEKKLGRGYVK